MVYSAMMLRCLLCAFFLVFCASGLSAKKRSSVLNNVLWGRSPVQSADLPATEEAPKPKAQKPSRNTVNLAKDTDYTIKTTEGFAAPADDDYVEAPTNDEDDVDESSVPDIDEDIEHLSQRLELHTRPKDPDSIFSLQNAFDAVTHAPKAFMLQQDEASAKSGTKLALAELLPDINTSYRYRKGRYYNPREKDKEAKDSDAHSLSVDASWVVFNGFAGLNTKKAADQNYKASQVAYTEGVSRLLLDTVKAYASAVASQNLILAHERKVALANEALKVSLSRHALGDITRSDLKTSRSALAKARSELEKARADQVRALTTLENLVDMELDDKHLIPITLPGEFPNSFVECREYALGNNYTIRKADLSLKALEFEKKAAYGKAAPSVRVAASAARSYNRNWDQGTLPRPDVIPGVNLSADISVQMPVDYKGTIAHQAHRRAYALEKERAQLRYTRLNVVLEVKKVWSEFIGADKSIKHLEAQVKASAEAWKALREGFKQGSKIGVELLQAERDYIAAEIDLIRTKQERLVHGFTLLHVIGNLNHTTLQSECPFAKELTCKKTGGTHDAREQKS